MNRLCTAFVRAIATAFLLIGIITSSSAKPEYAQKEGVACIHCHVSANPGGIDLISRQKETTDRNARGIYYGTHNHSLKGYVEAATTIKVKGPTFHYVWKEEFKELPRRIAVADVKGDGVGRLVMLIEKPDDKKSSTLEIRKWDGSAFVSEFSGDVHATADELAVGKLAGADRPAVIVTPDALWTWDGKTFVRRPAPNPLPILGVARMQDGSERLLLAPNPKEVTAYKVNLASVKLDDWLMDPIRAPSPPQNSWGDMHTTPEIFTSMGLPDILGSGGVVGIAYIKKHNNYYVYNMLWDRDFDVAADPLHPGKPKITFKGGGRYFVKFRDTAGAELWSSPRLPDVGYDIILDDPKGGGKPGFTVLFNGIWPAVPGTPPGKGRTIAYFAMD